MLKFIGKTITAAARVLVVCALVNELAYLECKVNELEREVNNLKGGKG